MLTVECPRLRTMIVADVRVETLANVMVGSRVDMESPRPRADTTSPRRGKARKPVVSTLAQVLFSGGEVLPDECAEIAAKVGLSPAHVYSLPQVLRVGGVPAFSIVPHGSRYILSVRGSRTGAPEGYATPEAAAAAAREVEKTLSPVMHSVPVELHLTARDVAAVASVVRFCREGVAHGGVVVKTEKAG